MVSYSRRSGNAERSSSEPEPIAPAMRRSRSIANARGRTLSARPSGHINLDVRLRRPKSCFSTPSSAPPVHLTLSGPAKWTITVLGPDDRPLRDFASLRTRSGHRSSPRRRSVADGLIEPLTVTTDGKGKATLPHLAGNDGALVDSGRRFGWRPAHVATRRVAGKERCPQAGPPGRVVGMSVRHRLPSWPASRWSSGFRGSGTYPENPVGLGERRITCDDIRLDPQPLKTGPQGAFQTPPILLDGTSYRVSIRHEGSCPLSPTGSRWPANAPRFRTFAFSRSRIDGTDQGPTRPPGCGRPGLRAGRGPATATDAQGRFVLAGIDAGKGFILTEKTGFRL